MNQNERRFDFHGLGAALKRAREEKGWTQAYVAELVDRDSRSGVGATVLAALPCVGWSVHVGQKRDFINPQGVDDDMHMDMWILALG